MPSATAGNLVLDSWTVRDPAGAPLTGQVVPTHVILTLRRQSGATMIAATEVIAWAEIGTTGIYYFSFTPLNTGLYLLILDEVGAATAGRRGIEFRWEVASAGSVSAPSYQNAFCAETDIERWLQQSITGTTQPSDTEATAFAESRAAVLMALCARLGNPVTPPTVTAGSRLEDLLREANSIGAALDYTIAQTFKTGASKTDRIVTLISAWSAYAGGPQEGFVTERIGYIEYEIRGNLASLATSHTLSGDTTPRADDGAPQDAGLQVRMTDVY